MNKSLVFLWSLMMLSGECFSEAAPRDEDIDEKSIQSSKKYYMEDFNTGKKKLCDTKDYWLISKTDHLDDYWLISKTDYLDDGLIERYINKNSLLKSIPSYGNYGYNWYEGRQLSIVTDTNGYPLFTVSGFYAPAIDCDDVTGDGNKEIVITSNFGGGNASFVSVVLTRDDNGDFKKIDERYSITNFVDLNQDGVKEAVWAVGHISLGFEYHVACFKNGRYEKCEEKYTQSYLEKFY